MQKYRALVEFFDNRLSLEEGDVRSATNLLRYTQGSRKEDYISPVVYYSLSQQ